MLFFVPKTKEITNAGLLLRRFEAAYLLSNRDSQSKECIVFIFDECIIICDVKRPKKVRASLQAQEINLIYRISFKVRPQQILNHIWFFNLSIFQINEVIIKLMARASPHVDNKPCFEMSRKKHTKSHEAQFIIVQCKDVETRGLCVDTIKGAMLRKREQYSFLTL